ncbi:putative dTDP-6-deoxy-L-hexose 3-O-methyltransferase [Mycobacterium kansasii]|uniref:Putative dTDP-6-deoxy-L-hexose 3-O-methyltransferase n=1 Tax=Mycobacterium kansasii TaxID=1768 RepID=A0A1V3XDD9_MYCKA|nr:putative dTDP-6-deoxy-L-hexose 3-O-methyltransferase [Mycobacterium kansasii]
MEDNQHTVVALLYLDFDLFEPTLAAIRTFLPRMPKGAVLAFDELNQKYWPARPLPYWSRPASGIFVSGDFLLRRKFPTRCWTDA